MLHSVSCILFLTGTWGMNCMCIFWLSYTRLKSYRDNRMQIHLGAERQAVRYQNRLCKFFALKSTKTQQRLVAMNNNTCIFPHLYWTLSLFSADCKDPGSPPNGVRSGNHFGHGKQITFACVKGFMLVGSATSICHKGTWTHALPSCKGWFRLNHSYSLYCCEFDLALGILHSFVQPFQYVLFLVLVG